MSVESAIYELVQESLGHDRIYPMTLPKDVVFPAATFQLVSSIPREYTHSGQQSWVQDRYQITLYGGTYDETLALATQIKATFTARRDVLSEGTQVGPIFVVGVHEDTDPETGRFRRIVELLISWQEIQ